MPLPPEEAIVRAICTEYYDSENERISPSLFKGDNTSVSRLQIIPLNQQWRVLAATVQKLPGRRLERLGEISVGRLVALGADYVANGKPRPIELSVEADPTPANSAHAVIPQKISIGLGKVIVNNLIKHSPPAGFDAEAIQRIA